MRTVQKTAIVLFVLAALLTACGGASTPEQTSSVSFVLTQGVQTMVAAYFGTQTALVPLATATPLPTFPALASDTPNPFASPIPTATWPFYTATYAIYYSPTVTGTVYTPTINPNTLAYGCDNLTFLVDQTVPSGTVFKPNTNFTKTWKVSNSGTCDWVYQYALTFVSGDALNAKTVKLGRVVSAGHWASLSLDMIAPKNPGTYTGYWRMYDADGHAFGSTLVVSIVVAVPTSTPAPTSTNTSAPTSTVTPTDTPVPPTSYP